MITGIFIPHDLARPLELRPFEDLTDYQSAVQGNIETVHFSQPRLAWVANEEGKLRQLPINRRATALWWLHEAAARQRDALVGSVVLFGLSRAGKLRDVPADVRDLLLATARYRLEVQLAESPTEWMDRERPFPNYFEAAAGGLHLAARWPNIVRLRITPF